ncbi:uncharacterized protein LOC134308102 isoform X2 [Trichomycterus rosablanca]|uniref:uncharacterized protein LOC134308102 isoform X2 n=1 Tax=Trichomycterus rosablanca TaxID=2290929 RepID=UPI002F35B405
MGIQIGASGSSEVSQPARTHTVQQEMQRSFPAIYSNRMRTKRKAPEPPTVIKFLELQFCLLEQHTDRCPKDETLLLRAGLGRRSVNILDTADHTEITRVLLEEYPKLQNLHGGWLLHKAAGGSGQRKTTPLPQGSQGYTAKILKSSSNNGKNIIYIVPLQEEIDMTPLPYDAPEFKNMPKNVCMTCGQSVPLQLLPFHIESCQQVNQDSGSVVEDEPRREPDVICMDTCPICGEQFAAEMMPYHASSCGESFPQIITTMNSNATEESASVSVVCESTVTESSTDLSSSGTSESWKRAEVPQRAAVLYRMGLVQEKETEPPLKFRLDIREDVEDQEAKIISFYKIPKVDWARPLYCKLQGDVATGEGVKRHFFSLVMHKLQSGFITDFGNGTSTVLFEGQVDHLVPSTSQVLVQSDLFLMAGRMIGHSFLHGGPLVAGLSPAIIHVLLGGSPQTAVILLEDVVDIDIRETLQLVLTGPSRQIKQFRQGLKESMIWPLLEARPDVVPVIFPRHSTAECNAQVVLDNIIWPSEEETDNDDGDGFPVAVKCKIAGYLRQFVETVTQDKLKQLVKFWVGWELPMKDMQVEVVQAAHPSSSTCFQILRLPGYYTSYNEFYDNLKGCIAHNDSGFGLI